MLIRYCRVMSVFVVAIMLAIMAIGCKKEAPPPVVADTKPKGPNYQEFAALKQAQYDIILPMIVGKDTEEEGECFVPVEDLEPVEADLELQQLFEQNQDRVKKAVVKWLLNDLEPELLTSTVAKSWTIGYEDIVVKKLPIERLAFTEDPTCLVKRGWLPAKQHLATTVIGVKGITFETKIPVKSELKESLIEAAGNQEIVVESDAFFVYEPVIDDSGKPMLDPEDQPLYSSPSGEFILEEDIPSEESRHLKSWVFRFETPLYVAFKEISDDDWRKERKRDDCDIIIIPDDPTPRPPECPEFQESAFSVTILEDEDEPVSISISTGEEIKGVVLKWKEATKIQVNDRIIIWIYPEQVEVGINLKVNSVVLNPKPMPNENGDYEEVEKEEVPVVAKEEPTTTFESDDDGEEKIEKKKKKKKKNQTAEDTIDDYLNI